ncbi:glycosyltransferase family A protein [uncultured Salinibacterium sp.]|uniref:glycosyltransferase family A protein n=1 Tax=uncultured Salinibacterium sp. TaxID=459274 RepID=UPI0030DA4E38|tara:strand:+ start:29792 stop:30859 length:1068 start_codon:yes stop_codon:yes gene_type:complete
MEAPLVDLVIAVHTSTRPISRAVASVVDHTDANIRVSVVAHNIDHNVIAANLGVYLDHPQVRLLALRDGIPSPAGPMNYGIDESSAQFLGVMGSDDELAPGAIDSWLALQRSTGAGMVMARIQNVGGGVVPAPPARPFRTHDLDPVKDRLSYRSAPLGIYSRRVFPDLRFSEGLASGEDLPFVAELWFSGAGIAFDRKGPAYLVHSDAEDRVTSDPRPVRDDFEFLDIIFERPWTARLNRSQREAFGVKIVRSHLFDALVNRADTQVWPEGERAALAEVARNLLEWAPSTQRLLSRLDQEILASILDPESSVDGMLDLIRQRWNYTSLKVLLPRNLLLALHRQAPLRTYAAGYLV